MMKCLLLGTILIILVGLSIPAPALATQACGDSYKIVQGDTLSKIAKRCGITLSGLILANPQIEDPSLIYAGQTLYLPRKAEPLSIESPTLVNRPEADRLNSKEIESLGIEKGSREPWIDVDLSSQTISAYAGHKVLRTFLVSTGTWRNPTVTGRFWIHTKYETDDMRGPGYFFEDVPHTIYFHKGYGLHGTYWHNNFGTPMSHGCVNLAIEDAEWMFRFAEVGTMVNVHH